MNDSSCVNFLLWALPKLRYQWRGFRRVRRQVCRRIQNHIRDLELADFKDYRDYLESHQGEWPIFDSMCYITVSRFFRDRRVFQYLETDILPQLVRSVSIKNQRRIRCWSAGCCSGEEPYSLKILLDNQAFKETEESSNLEVIATEREDHLIERARRAVYSKGALKDMPENLVETAFVREGRFYRLKERLKTDVVFLKQDIRYEMPTGRYHLIFCRNLVFTYFEESLQVDILNNIVDKLYPGGYLIVGSHEVIPVRHDDLVPVDRLPMVYGKSINNV